MTSPSRPPQAPKRPVELVTHEDRRVDNWYWLREKEGPEVVSHLEAENAYTAAQMSETEGMQQGLFEEIVGRIQETDLSVPVLKNGWFYYNRTEEGRQYGIYCRLPEENGKPAAEDREKVMLDANREAEGHEYFDLGMFDVSLDGRRLAFSTDVLGNEIFTLRIRDLATGDNLDDVIEGTHFGSAWDADSSHLFYVRPDATLRPYQVWRHEVGQPSENDQLVYQEDDEKFFVGLGNSKTDDFIVITSASSLTTEVRVVRSIRPLDDFSVIAPRRPGVEYSVAHHRSSTGPDRFFIVTNEDAPNFKLMEAPVDNAGPDNWTEVVGHRTDVKLDRVEAFRDFLVLSERAEANAQLSVLDLNSGNLRVLEQPEEIYTAHAMGNAEFDTSVLRYEYTSLVTPRSIYDVDLTTDERNLLKSQPVLGDFDPAHYASRREWATAADGTRVPISLVYSIERPDAPGPTLLYGYGSYGMTMDAAFSSLRLSLLDRGFVFAIAHVRGGGDLGRLWYEHGKFFEKTNTFTDFISCAEHLIGIGVTTPDQLIARGGSAGGLLMGAIANSRPDLFRAIVAEVPFVDVLTTMLDASLPLTVHEYEEWGNPNEVEVYEYMKSYSPYDNVTEQAYPQMLVTAGLNDPRVSYWEPAKWVQKLREHATGDPEILLKTEMGAGHMGASGRYDAWHDEAFIYAFLLRALGLRDEFTAA